MLFRLAVPLACSDKPSRTPDEDGMFQFIGNDITHIHYLFHLILGVFLIVPFDNFMFNHWFIRISKACSSSICFHMARPQAFPSPLVFRISVQPSRLGSYHSIIGSCEKRGQQFLRCRETSAKLGFCLQSVVLSCSRLGARRFNSSYSEVEAERSEKTFPCLAKSRGRKQREVGSGEVSKGFRSSWEESAEKFLKGRIEIREARKFEGRRNEMRNADDFSEDGDRDVDGDGDVEVVDDPRWDKIRNNVNKFVEVKSGSERSDVRKWSNQENWGRKTWKEAKESTVPKLVGEGIYGVGPVLAALSAARREFYALYVQEGLDLSTNNRKKKDKKGFEKVLRMAEKHGLSQKEVSKHDLNMVVDNRPHQGLVLDASPLEMVGVKELEPISIEGEKGPLWLALDEVTDPQNLGAIIRSAYFFGASGIVLCAKNSAPLSGVVSKASAGSLELMELRSCKNMMQFLTSSSRNGWRVLGGSVSSKTVPLNEVVPGAPTILVLGSEGMGLRPLVERSCTQLIRISGNLPIDLIMTGDEDTSNIENPGQEFRSFLAVESLNVSVAAGVMLNHLIGSTCDSVTSVGPVRKE